LLIICVNFVVKYGAEYGHPLIVIPWVVLQELDFIKNHKQVCSLHSIITSCLSFTVGCHVGLLVVWRSG